MKSLAFLSIISLALVAATTGDPTGPQNADYPQQKTDEDIPIHRIPQFIPQRKDFGFSLPFVLRHHDQPRDLPHQPTFFDLLHGHLNTVHRQFSPGFLHTPLFQTPGGIAPGKPEDGTGVVVLNGKECFGCKQPWSGVFDKIFGNSFKKHLSSFNTTLFKNLPPNYKNSTSNTHVEDGSKVVVNQTIHKETGDNFHHFVHVKVIHVLPNGETEVTEEEVPEVIDIPDDDTTTQTPSFDRADDEVVVDSENYSQQLKRRLVERAAESVSPKNKKIILPPPHINQFPHSMANNKKLVRADATGKGKGSSTWVYKNMGGKSYLYAINHNNKAGKYNKKSVSTNRDAETVGPPKPVDLSRDTRVNPDGSGNQQGFSMVEPHAEVFNLTLVIKEAESRANSD